MAVHVYRFDSPGRFIAGTVGEPGERTFFLQARDDTRLITVALEKEQVAVLAERVDVMLDDIASRSEGVVGIPTDMPADAEDLQPLEQPIVEEFRVGTLTLSWDPVAQRVMIAAYAATDGTGESADEPPDDPEDSDRDALVVGLTGEEARAFVQRSLSLVAAGRATCPLCGLPLDADGHICPRQNGYRRQT